MSIFDSIVVSDYDGTIKREDELKEIENLLFLIKKLIYLKKAFMISTGRLYDSMRNEIDHYNIPIDFVSCANGNVLFDKNWQTLWKTTINDNVINILKPYYKYILDIIPQDEHGNITTKEKLEYVIELAIIDKKIRKEIIHLLTNNNMLDYCIEGENKNKIHVFNRSNKVQTIELCRNVLGVRTENIYTIGNGVNDLEMIKKYNGFCIKNTMNDYINDILAEYETVEHFISDIQNSKIKKRSM